LLNFVIMNCDIFFFFHGLDQRKTEGRCIVLFVEVESWEEDYIRYFFVVGAIFVHFEVDLSISFEIPIGISFDDKFGFIYIL
jgi:hypothetical protein